MLTTGISTRSSPIDMAWPTSSRKGLRGCAPEPRPIPAAGRPRGRAHERWIGLAFRAARPRPRMWNFAPHRFQASGTPTASVAIRDGRSEMSEIDDKWREIPGDQHIGWSRDAPQLTVGPGLTPANGIGPGWLEAGAQMLARGSAGSGVHQRGRTPSCARAPRRGQGESATRQASVSW